MQPFPFGTQQESIDIYKAFGVMVDDYNNGKVLNGAEISNGIGEILSEILRHKLRHVPPEHEYDYNTMLVRNGTMHLITYFGLA